MWKPIKDYPYATEHNKNGPEVLLQTEVGMVVASCGTYRIRDETYHDWHVNGVEGYEFENSFSKESISHFMDLPEEPK